MTFCVILPYFCRINILYAMLSCYISYHWSNFSSLHHFCMCISIILIHHLYSLPKADKDSSAFVLLVYLGILFITNIFMKKKRTRVSESMYLVYQRLPPYCQQTTCSGSLSIPVIQKPCLRRKWEMLSSHSVGGVITCLFTGVNMHASASFDDI